MSRQVKNILFVLVDQLRWDYLSCYGHPHLETTNIDWLAENGVRFEHAYVQSPVCGPSRACILTGRYMSSHGVMSNTDPIPLSEKLFGEYLRPLGMKTAVVGKTDHRPDLGTMARYGIDPESETGQRIIYRDFDPYDRFIGLHADPVAKPGLQYNDYLNEQGYDGDNPWQNWAQAVVDDEGNVRDGRIWSNSKYPSRLPDEHGESAYVTNRAIDFMEETGDEPWCLSLGYYKPHWPYVANKPYHDMYPPETHLPVRRSEAELNGHEYLTTHHKIRLSNVFSRHNARTEIVTAYMGLVKQMDDHFGRLLDHMRKTGLIDNTLIVFTSDHGDNLGDHWCGEKDLPHDCSTRVPLLIYDPSPEADATRGTTETRFAELIDILPTFIETAGGDLYEHQHLLEGRSLHPLLRGDQDILWRDYAISEMDFSLREFGKFLDMPLDKTRGYMIRNERWKYATFEGEEHPMLFDMHNDPHELSDLGACPDHVAVCAELSAKLFHWLRNLKHRSTVTYDELTWRYGVEFEDEKGILIGWWEDEDGRNFGD
ncbi:MAG: sulfatase-like hydrolase/transferase [Chloroflexota bacterium]